MEELIELTEEVGIADDELDFEADAMVICKTRRDGKPVGASIVGCVDDHPAFDIIAARMVGDVEHLAFGSFVPYKSAKRLNDLMLVTS